MKRCVKEIYNEINEELTRIEHERNEEYLEARLILDKTLKNTERGLSTDIEAVKKMIDTYYWVY